MILILGSVVWGLYKWWKTRNERIIYALLLGVSVLLRESPLGFLPIEFTLACWGLLGFGVLLYKGCYQIRDKTLVQFSLVFLTFALVFLFQGLFKPIYPTRLEVDNKQDVTLVSQHKSVKEKR